MRPIAQAKNPIEQTVDKVIEDAIQQALGQSGQNAATLAVLQEQLRDVSRELEVTYQMRASLVDRLGSTNGQARAVLNEQVAAVDAQAAALQAKFSALVRQIADAEAGRNLSEMLTPPPPPSMGPPFGIDPDAISAAFLMLSLGVIIPLSIGLSRRLGRRPAAPAVPIDAETVSKARLDRLEQAVDTIAIEIERISEGQRFVTRVLSERPANVQQPPSSEPAQTAALGTGAPFLALGAGPMEPIPLAQRQAVKQSITPH